MTKKLSFYPIVLSLLIICFSTNIVLARVASISPRIKKELTILREEEKLARDVYLYAYGKYHLSVFQRIAQSEQRHMDSVLWLLKKYNIPDPASPQRGIFHNKELQHLYNTLISKVNISLLDALKVGATIEDLDIKDIEKFKTTTSIPYILRVYDRLCCGSRNHLRCYYREIIQRGGNYSPQYISLEYFQKIINSPRERCGRGRRWRR